MFERECSIFVGVFGIDVFLFRYGLDNLGVDGADLQVLNEAAVF